MDCGAGKNRKTLGFSMVEMVIVIAIIMILLAVSFIEIPSILKDARANAAVSETLNQIRLARERAVDERRSMRITFTAPGTILMEYQFTDPVTKIISWLPATGQAGKPGAGTVLLPFDIQFITPPTAASTAPDAIGAQTNALDFYCAGTACTGVALYFNPDGSITNVNNDPVQGVVYTARPTEKLSARAVSFFGPTGRAKAWRYAESSAAPTKRWIQQ